MSVEVRGPEEMVRSRFEVKESFTLPDGELEFQVVHGERTGRDFVELTSELKPLGYRPEMSGSAEECVLTIRKAPVQSKTPPRLPVFLVLFTLASVVVFGILQEFVYNQLAPDLSPYLAFFGFAFPIALVMGAHEAVQRAVARKKGGGKASSYLIPGIPYITSFLPSLGFLSSQREPAMNRDALFDTVIAGPLVVLALAIIFYTLGDATAVRSSIPFVGSQVANSTVTINPNAIQAAIDSLVLRPVASGYIQLSPLADGATVAFTLALIGFLPMVSFDGGYLTNLALGSRAGRALSYASVLVLLVLDTPNYWALAVVVLLLVGRPFQIRTLDGVTPLSSTRRWLFVGTLVLAALCIPFPQNLASFPLP